MSTRCVAWRSPGAWPMLIAASTTLPCFRLLLVLSGLNRRYFTRFQVKRLRLLASRLAVAPPDLAERIEALLAAAPREAFAALHGLEGEAPD